MHFRKTLRIIGLLVSLNLLVLTTLAARHNPEIPLVMGQSSCSVTIKASDSVQPAIDAAPARSVVCLEAGTWEANLRIAKELTLRGAGRDQTIIKGSIFAQPVLTIEADNEIQVSVESLAFTEGKLAPVLRLGGRARATLTNLALSDGFFGLHLVENGSASVVGTLFTKNGFDGIRIEGNGSLNLQKSTLVGNLRDGLIVRNGTARVEIKDNSIVENRHCGISVQSIEANIRGTPNEMQRNGSDLCGFVSASLRKPLTAARDKTQLTVPGDFATVQEAVDAIAPGGVILIQKGSFPVGVTLWKAVTLRGAGKAETVLQAHDNNQLVLSVIAEAQAVTIRDLTITGSQGDGIYNYGQLSIENATIANHRHNGLEVAGVGKATISRTTVAGNRGDGLSILEKAQLILTDSLITNNGSNSASGLDVEGGASARITATQIKGNRGRGIDAAVSSNLTVIGSQISNNSDDGIVARDAATIQLQNSEINSNSHGLTILDKAQVTLTGTTISSNLGSGVDLNGAASVEVRQSLIELNGQGDDCKRADTICNGVVAVAETQVIVQDSTVRQNADWGVGVWLKRCNAVFDFFTGKVVFDGTNTIADNNRSGNLNGRGNPGIHPFKTSPDGQVCLP